MDTVTIEQVSADHPPAGTPCIVCKGNGHWCQAEQYAAGDGDAGICNACFEGKDCQVVALRKTREFTFEPEADRPAPEPARSVPVTQAIVANEPSAPIQLLAPTATALVDLPRHEELCEAIAQRLLKLDPGETVSFLVPPELKIREFERGLLEFLAGHPQTKDVKWIHKADPTGTRLVMATMANVKKITRLAMPRPPKAVEAPSAEKVSPRHDLAKSMLRDGYGTQVIQDRTGLARNTVIKIKREMGLPVGTQFNAPAVDPAAPVAREDLEPQAASLKSETHDWEPVFNEVLRLNVGDWINLAVAPGFSSGRYANNLRVRLNTDARSKAESWSVKTVGFGGKVHVIRNGAAAGKGLAEPTITPATAPAPKPELAVATPVTIVTVQADAPKSDMTLSRAFELVIAEMEASVDNLRDSQDDSDEWKDCIKSQEALVGELRGWHPANMGTSATGCRTSIYERAMERAEAELRIIKLEIQRLEMRKKALEPVLAALKTSIYWERESR